MDNDFKANVTYIKNKLQDEGYIEGAETFVQPQTHAVGFRLKNIALFSDFFHSLEKTLTDAHEWTGKDYHWYIMYMHTLQCLEITFVIS